MKPGRSCSRGLRVGDSGELGSGILESGILRRGLKTLTLSFTM
jgi:hypothetical protein